MNTATIDPEKPREFWLFTNSLGQHFVHDKPLPSEHYNKPSEFHVIEYSAYEQAMNYCKHPRCCCVCGHQGLCPEDGPTAGLSDAITD